MKTPSTGRMIFHAMYFAITTCLFIYFAITMLEGKLLFAAYVMLVGGSIGAYLLPVWHRHQGMVVPTSRHVRPGISASITCLVLSLSGLALAGLAYWLIYEAVGWGWMGLIVTYITSRQSLKMLSEMEQQRKVDEEA